MVQVHSQTACGFVGIGVGPWRPWSFLGDGRSAHFGRNVVRTGFDKPYSHSIGRSRSWCPVVGWQGRGGKDNAIVVVNRHDGKNEHRAGLGTARVLSEAAGNKNFAYAYSSCTDCKSAAVAVQIVLIMSNPAVVTPQNFAIAVNELCTRCTTVAFAYQYVITTDGVARFSAEANSRMASLERQISSLAGSAELDPPTLEARVDPLVKQIWGLVDDELVKVGRPAEKQEKKDKDVATEDNTPNPTPPPSTPGPSPSPALSPSPSPSPRETSTPTSTASPSPSAA